MTVDPFRKVLGSGQFLQKKNAPMTSAFMTNMNRYPSRAEKKSAVPPRFPHCLRGEGTLRDTDRSHIGIRCYIPCTVTGASRRSLCFAGRIQSNRIRCAAPGMYFTRVPLMSCTTDISLEGSCRLLVSDRRISLSKIISQTFSFVKPLFEFLYIFQKIEKNPLLFRDSLI